MRSTLLFCFICIPVLIFSQVDTIIWEKLSPMPGANQINAAGYFLIDSDFYVAGGQINDAGYDASTVWQYHIPTDTWYQKSNLPFGAASTEASFVLNSKGYFLIARDSVNNYNCVNQFWEYAPVVDSWTQKANFPDSPRQNSSCFVYGGKGYVGQTDGCQEDDEHFWEYDPILDQWSQIATLPADIIAGSVAVATSSADAYLFGGFDFDGNFLKDVWQYNINTNLWDSVGLMPGLGRCYSTFWGFDSVIIGGGGQTSDNNTILTLGNDFYKYNITTNVWTPVVFLNSFDSTGAGASFIYNKHAYYFGGYQDLYPNTTFSNNMWSFDASKYLTDTSVGIKEIRPDVSFSVYPNPVVHEVVFTLALMLKWIV